MNTIFNILDNTAKKYGEKTAVIQGEKYFTYRQLYEASIKTAQYLVSLGVTKGDKIAILSSKDLYEVICIFAAARIGAVFININPHYQQEQVLTVIEDCKAKVLFVNNNRMDKFTDDWEELRTKKNLHVICFGNKEGCPSIEQIFSRYLPTAENREIGANDLAAIIYTSGSTGKPKGIIITHQIFFDSTVISVQVLGNTDDDRIISITPFSFDGALSQLFTSVYVGAVLVLQESLLPHDIVKTMLEEKITGFHGMPSLWKMLLQKRSPLRRYEYKYLRYISIIGEPLAYQTYEELKAIFPNTRIYVMYGTTEAFRSTYTYGEEFEQHYPSVGKPLPGVEIHILDEDGKECVAGQIGEIVHEGVFISPGYWQDDKLTKERFKNNMCYTLDLGYVSKDKFLYLEGRKDLIVKVMGYRINLLEIEETIQRYNGVVNVIVGIYSVSDGSKKIYAVIETDVALAKSEIFIHCKKKLPYYMVPSIIHFTQSLPKTSNYKVDRKSVRIEDFI